MRLTQILKKSVNKVSLSYFSLMSFALSANATSVGGSYPWDAFMQKIVTDLQSNFAIFLGIVGLVVCGGFVMFGDLQGGARKAFNIGLGLSIMLNVGTVLSALFGASGAVIH
ncbi:MULTISPECIES: TrbC/VirB2 family protein [Cysteiniphilum]|uniref:Conjugal transfer protein TrbC n=1 Tax=Cysteiniphilum litorale TaxID=2056700 RepID=A0A8J2Z3A4_9GAMM|nr:MULTISPECIES: TrbC/VirB2 family protein [Cysteiniphilum]GGF93772.1 hypothetical protein GCM10010995_08730 [Cysteiniphilum litorale]